MDKKGKFEVIEICKVDKNKKKILENLEICSGSLKKVADETNIKQDSIYRYLREDKDFKKQFNFIKGKHIKYLTEDKIIDAINDENKFISLKGIELLLKLQARKDGRKEKLRLKERVIINEPLPKSAYIRIDPKDFANGE